MGGYASGKRSWAISDRSGLRFPYTEMVREWNGALVHTSEFEAKQPQLSPKPVGNDPQALYNPRPQPASKTSLILLGNNPFTTVKVATKCYMNVFSPDHQRSAGDIVRFRGNPQVTSAGPGGADEADTKNLQAFANIPTFDGVASTGLGRSSGFTISLGEIDSAGNVTGATTTDPLTQPINYFYIALTGFVLAGTVGGVSGGGANCSAGPVTLGVVNG